MSLRRLFALPFLIIPSIASAHELPFGHAHPHPDRMLLLGLGVGSIAAAAALLWTSRRSGE